MQAHEKAPNELRRKQNLKERSAGGTGAGGVLLRQCVLISYKLSLAQGYEKAPNLTSNHISSGISAAYRINSAPSKTHSYIWHHSPIDRNRKPRVLANPVEPKAHEKPTRVGAHVVKTSGVSLKKKKLNVALNY